MHRRHKTNLSHPPRTRELRSSRPSRAEQSQPAPPGADTLSFLEGQPALRGKHAENQVPDYLPHILVDCNQLSQVLMNLLINAAEATPDGGRITISARQLTYSDSVEIRVSDTDAVFPPTLCRTSSNRFLH